MAYFVGPVLPGFGEYVSSVLMSAPGQKRTSISARFGLIECPLSVRPDIQAGPMSALRSEPDIRLEWQLKARSGHSQVLKPN